MVKWCNKCKEFREDNSIFCGWCGAFLQDNKIYPNFKTLQEKIDLLEQIKNDCDAQRTILTKQLNLFN